MMTAESTRRAKFSGRYRNAAIARCPHCESPGTIRSSEEVTILHRDLWLICTNADCGHSWKAQLSFVHSISLPANPRPGLDLPVGQNKRRHDETPGTDPPHMTDAA